MSDAQHFGLAQQRIQVKEMLPEFGEVFTCSSETDGALELVHEFKGKKIVNMSGGLKRAFLFQQLSDRDNVIIALHPENEDVVVHQSEQVLPIQQILQKLQGLKVRGIECGKNFSIILTQQGIVFSYGKGQFGSLGTGGVIFSPSPIRINKLKQRTIVSVACGMLHTLALSHVGDLYSWGRGFEGQLGLLQAVQTVAFPQYIPHFFKYNNSKQAKLLQKNPIKFIACGAYHSIAIDNKGQLYCWGEAIHGQTGNGKKTKEPVPVKIQLTVSDQGKSSKRKIKAACGGFGHTLCLTDQGELFSWGLNIKGQLGLCDLPQNKKPTGQDQISYQKAAHFPVQLKYNSSKQPLPLFKEIACGFSRSFAIDESGKAWGWGGGLIGFKGKTAERGPVELTEGTETRVFSKVYANEDALVLFAPLKTLFFKPMLIPARGGAQITFFGNGFANTGKQTIRLYFGSHYEEIGLEFDSKTSTYYCKTPNLEKIANVTFPCQCKVMLTLDKVKYFPFDNKLLIYASKLGMQSFEPKLGSALGGSELSIRIELPKLVLDYSESIVVGFKNNSNAEKTNRFQDWLCSEGHYEDGIITCKLPAISNFNNQNPFYMVDVSVNGQEFTQFPQTIRYYLISDIILQPSQGLTQGEYQVKIQGKGLFDTPNKHLIINLKFEYKQTPYECRRKVDLKWDAAQKSYLFTMPSLAWVIGDHELSPQLMEEARKQALILSIFLSKGNQFRVGKFSYSAPPPPQVIEEPKKDAKKDAKKGAKK